MGAKKIAETRTENELIGEVSRVISELTGVQLGQKQFALVQSRLGKRLRDLKISDPLAYSRYYNANEGIEIGVLTSLLTTHHTFFFREFQHFEFLLKTTLPRVIESHRAQGQKTVRIWSAACSRGQEVYSLSMFLKQHLAQLAPEMNYEITGTDICEESVAIAKNGVYTWEELRVVPAVYLQGNWSKGTGEIEHYVRAKQDIRKQTSFKLLNLLDVGKSPFGPGAKFDIIFCRNVFIYFTQDQIKTITGEFMKMLNPSGHLFVGLSESLNGLGLPISWIGPSVYEHTHGARTQAKVVNLSSGTEAKSQSSSITKPAAQPVSQNAPGKVPTPSLVEATKVQPAEPIRVLCVDDSPTVLLLLKRILTPEKGFNLIGTASDGVDAYQKVKTLKPDIVTLDIHMPKMTGVEFLEKYHKELGTPVVVVSSVPRDDASLAYKCLELGASDYIEKPSASNLDKVDEELIFKLKVAEESWRKTKSGTMRSRALELDASFKRPPQILDPKGKLRLLICDFSSRDVAQVLLKGFTGTQPATVVMLENAGDIFEGWVKKFATQIPGGQSGEVKSLAALNPGSIYFMEMQKGIPLFNREGIGYTVSCLVVGPMNRNMVQQVSQLSVSHMIVEDRGSENPKSILTKASLVVPLTSFVYESDRFLAENNSSKKGGAK